MLALGDAIAVSLIDFHKFNKNQFGVFHPGGKLGSNFLKTQELMRKDEQIPLVTTHQTMSEVLIEMTSKHLGCTGVINADNEVIGIITDGDLRRHIGKDFLNSSVQDTMTPNPLSISQNTLAVEAITIMNKHSITSIFVLNENKNAVGILHLQDCLRSGVV